MKNSERYAFFLDIDGTLFANRKIPEKNIQAIKYAREKGHLVFINTARCRLNAMKILGDIEFDGLVSGLGGCIVYNGEKIRSERIEPTELAELVDRFIEKNIEFVFEGEDILIGVMEDWDDFEDLKSGKEFLDNYSDKTIAKVFMSGTLPESEQKFLGEKYNFYQHRSYAEFAPKGCSKADGIDFVCEHFGIDKSHCVAMGDSANDIEMLRCAGISVAMGDATDEVKAISTFVTCDAKDGGVAEGIQKVLGV